MALYISIIAVCCVFSAFFSASDMIYGMIDKERLKKAIENGNKRAKAALKLAENYEFSISSILFGNNIVNILASSMLTLLALAIASSSGWEQGTVTTIATVIFTVFVIIFCEFLPKSFAKKFNYSLGLAFAYPVTFFKYLTAFIVWPISKMFVLFGKLFKKRSKREEAIDEDILTEMVNTIEEEGGLEEGEAELVRSAIDLNDIKVFEIMTPRVDVFAIDVEDDIDEILKEGEIFIHSRIPVYEDTIDNIIGILPLKALLKVYLKGEKIDVRSLCYQPLFIPRSHQVLDMLEEFKTSKVHIAIVVDEYGGTEGIVTMEDILEEIVGDIFDESDEIEDEFVDKGEGKYIVDGAMNIDDFFELIGIDPEDVETDYITVGGFCQEQLDKFCEVGDTFDFLHFTFKILEADKYTVEKVSVIDNEYEEETDE